MSPEDPSLSTRQMETLADVLDTLIPASADGRLPGAGAVGLTEPLWETLSTSTELVPFYRGALDGVSAAARERGADRLGGLEPDARAGVLNEVEATYAGFVGALVYHAYVAYYQHPDVMTGLGLEPRPPHPLGYEIAENDLDLLDPVRARGGLYREA